MIKHYELMSGQTGQFLGNFKCRCGFTYRRPGPDRDGITRLTCPTIIETGEQWSSEFRKCWNDENLTLDDIGERFGLTRHRIKMAGIHLGLPLNRRGRAIGIPPGRRRWRNWDQLKETVRSRFLRCLRDHPRATRTDLQKKFASREWKLLRKYDPEWLELVAPPSKEATLKKNGGHRNDWEQFDKELAAKVLTAKNSLLEADGPPRRITKTSILHQLGLRSFWCEKDCPRTKAEIDAATETRPERAARKLMWLISRSRTNSRGLSLAMLLRKATVKRGWETHPAVAEAVTRAKSWLKSR